MAVRGEREQGVLDLDLEMLESMVQDEIPVQDINMQDEFPPQPNPELEMGAAAEAVVHDTPTSSVKIPPQSPADPRQIMANRLPRG